MLQPFHPQNRYHITSGKAERRKLWLLQRCWGWKAEERKGGGSKTGSERKGWEKGGVADISGGGGDIGGEGDEIGKR